MTIILGDTLIMPMSKSIKVSVKSELPLMGEENEIILISEVQTENFFISNNEPTVSDGDVWIVSGEEGEHSIQFGKDSKSKIILLGAQQKTEDGWSRLDGYVWVGSEWVQFSSKSIEISKMPIPSKVKYGEYVFTVIAQNHPGYPEDSTSLFYSHWATSYWIDYPGVVKYSDKDCTVRNLNISKFNSFDESFKNKVLDTTIYFKGSDGVVYSSSEKMFAAGAGEFNINGRPTISGQQVIERLTSDIENTCSTRDKNPKGVISLTNGVFSDIIVEARQNCSSIVNIQNSVLVSPTPNPDGSYNLIL